METVRCCPVALIPFGVKDASVTLFPPQNKRGKNRRNTFEVKVRYPANQEDQVSYVFPVFFTEDMRGMVKKKISPKLWEADLGKILVVLRSLRFDPLKNAVVLEKKLLISPTNSSYLREGKSQC